MRWKRRRIRARARKLREWTAMWAKAEREGHELWLQFGGCGRYDLGHDANCRCHNGSPVLLDTRPSPPIGGEPKP